MHTVDLIAFAPHMYTMERVWAIKRTMPWSWTVEKSWP